MKVKFYWPLLLLGAALLSGASWSPGNYPGVYNSGSSLVTSGVIWAGPNISLMGACEFYTNSGSAQYFMIYNSPTVAGQAVANMVAFCGVGTSAPQQCSVGGPNPLGPQINGAIQAGKGLSWSASTTFPSQTQPSANSFALCTFQTQ